MNFSNFQVQLKDFANCTDLTRRLDRITATTGILVIPIIRLLNEQSKSMEVPLLKL